MRISDCSSDVCSSDREVLLLAVRSRLPTASPAAAAISAAKIAEIPALFAEIAARSENGEHLRAVMSLNDRLHSARLSEPLTLSGIEDEFATMRTLLDDDDRSGLRRAIVGYHRRRHRLAHELVRAIYRQI